MGRKSSGGSRGSWGVSTDIMNAFSAIVVVLLVLFTRPLIEMELDAFHHASSARRLTLNGQSSNEINSLYSSLISRRISSFPTKKACRSESLATNPARFLAL